MIFNNLGNAEPVQESELNNEAVSMIMEAAISDVCSTDEVSAFLENHSEVQAATRDEVLTERTIVRLDKQARLTHAQRMAVFTIAKEKNDSDFRKLVTVWRMERLLEDRLNKKYGNEGLRRARSAMNKSANSKSGLVKKVAKNVQKQLNGARA